jgi:HK97 family phage prohead protease
MLTKDFSLKISAKSLDESSGVFVGLAAVFNNLDLASDHIMPGAFSQAVAQQGSNGFPLLWAHRTDEPIGTARIAEVKDGLLCTGKILLSDVNGAKASNLIKNNVVRGLSFGFTLPPESSGKTVYNSDGSRVLKEIVVHEISIVSIPCNPAALIANVKSLSQVETMLRGVRPGDVKGDTLMQLRGIDTELKRLLKKDALCECDCEECLAGDCADCSDPECVDSNCEGSVKARQAAEELAMLKVFAVSLKSITT